MSLLPLLLTSCLSSEGSVWWKWWNSSAMCLDDKESNVIHHEWGPKDECLHAETLQVGDPIRLLGEDLINALESSWGSNHGRKIDVKVCYCFFFFFFSLLTSREKNVKLADFFFLLFFFFLFININKPKKIK